MHVVSAALADERVGLVEAKAWRLLRALAARAKAGRAVIKDCGVRVDADGVAEEVALGTGWLDLYPEQTPPFRVTTRIAASVERLLDLYLPLCVGTASHHLVIGHVAQSLDGQIATASGASCYITGHDDLVHTHRLRALADAVVVGRATVVADDPRLTTRLVPGPNPTRVVVDPGLRAPLDRRIFRDGMARTLILCAPGSRRLPGHGQVEIVELATREAVFPPAVIVEELRSRGLRRLFVEGGGVTVSNFLRAGLLDRLHVAVSPVFLGCGRPGVMLPPIDGLGEALRPRVRRFTLGEDTLFDCRF